MKQVRKSPIVSVIVIAIAIAIASSLTACTGLIGGRDDDANRSDADAAPPEIPPNDVAIAGLRRLTIDEYDNSVRDLLGDETRPSSSRLPPDSRSPFDNDYTRQIVSPVLIEGADVVAAQIAQRLLADVARRDRVLPCVPSGPADEACFRRFIVVVGRRALRHGLSEDEITRYLRAHKTSIDEGDFYAGIDVAIRAMLQDPQFLYRVEVGVPVVGRPGLFRLTDFEVATRLSFFLWGSTPDDRLLDHAAAGKLRTADEVRAAAAELLSDPRARGVVTRFHAMWLGFEQTPSVTGAMRAETAALLDRVIFEGKGPWQDIFRAGETYVPDALASHYGLKTHGSEAPAWTSYAGTDRRGILSHGSFLSIGARGDDSSPTLRGKAVRTRLLCETVLPPPPGVKVDEPPPKTAEAPCKADRYKEHAARTECKGCHAQIDPIGFGLEQYDARGRHRTKDDGPDAPTDGTSCPIDGNGEVAGVGTFHGPGELGDALLKKGMSACLVKQLYRFANGRTNLDETDTRVVDALVKQRSSAAPSGVGGNTNSIGGDFRLDEVLIDIVSNPAFGYRRDE